MRILISADWHLSSYKTTYFDVGEQLVNGLLKLVQIIREKSPDMIIIAGDIYNDKVYIYKNASEMVRVYFLDQIKDIPIIFIAGNHDKGKHGCLLEEIEAFNYPNVSVVCDKFASVGSDILLLPYDRSHMHEYLMEEGPNYPILISHFGLNEAKLNNGLSRIDPIKLSQLPNKLVILGHYHTPQSIYRAKQNQLAIYTGSLVPKDWNDKNEVKRVIILDTDIALDDSKDRRDAIESIPIRGDNIFEFKEYVLEITDSTSLSKLEASIDKILNSNLPNHITRVIVPPFSPNANIDKEVIANLPKQLERLRKANIIVITTTSMNQGMKLLTEGEGEGKDTESLLTKSFMELCEWYVKSHPEQKKLSSILQEILATDDEV